MRVNRNQLIYGLAIYGVLIINFLFMNKSFYTNAILGYGAVLAMTLLMAILSCGEGFVLKLYNADKAALLFFLVGQIIASIISAVMSLPVSVEVHRIVSFALMYIIFGIESKKIIISYELCERFLMALVLFGVFSFVYDMILNWNRLFDLRISIMYIKHNGNYYTSFFKSRTISAIFSFFALNASLYFISRRKGIRFFIAYICNVIHILFSSARMPVAMAFLSSAMVFVLDKKLRKHLRWIVAMALIYLLLNYHSVLRFFNTNIVAYFTHVHAGVSSSDVRLHAWKSFWDHEGLIQFIFGYGMGSQTELTSYFDPTFRPAAYHSMYIDALCQGGLILLLILIAKTISVLRKVLKNIRNESYRIFCFSLTAGYMGIMLTDSSGGLFDFTELSILATAVIIGLPLSICSFEKKQLSEMKE